jgi:hypothetical protein
MLKGEGRIFRKGDSGGHVLYISKDVTSDSAYPFQHGDAVQIEIDPVKKCFVVSKKE